LIVNSMTSSLKDKPAGLIRQWWREVRNPSRQRPDYVLLGLIGAIVVIGLVVLYSASSVVGFQDFGSSSYYVRQQILKGVLPGLVFLWVAARVPSGWWQSAAIPFMILAIGLLVATFIPGVGAAHRNIRSWIDLGSISFQPSELAKLALVVYLARWLSSRREHQVRGWLSGLLPFFIFLAIIGLLLMLQPDLGTLIITVAIALTVYMIGGARFRHLAIIVGVGVAAVLLLAQLAPYRAARLTTFLNPTSDLQGTGYHVNQAVLAIGAGGWWGRGLGQSVQKYDYLPEAQGDSIFAVMAEEFGFLLTLGFIALWIFTIMRIWRVAAQAPDRFSQLVVSGIVSWFAWQSVLNIGGMLRLVPLTGLPLPFISYGGTAMTVNLLVVGIVLSISRTCRPITSAHKPVR
jgi:cell division protein FtsW